MLYVPLHELPLQAHCILVNLANHITAPPLLLATGNAEAAKKVGMVIAERAKAKGIEVVVFDRGGYIYHGRVAALAEGAREGGLKF